jgi:hypothetical protein
MARKAASKKSAEKSGQTKQSDERLVTLFLDMLAAERGAGKNTLAA